MYNIITISREYGSGGRYVGKLLAEKLGVPFYDKELIHMLAEKSNYSSEYIDFICEIVLRHDLPLKKTDIINNLELSKTIFEIQKTY